MPPRVLPHRSNRRRHPGGWRQRLAGATVSAGVGIGVLFADPAGAAEAVDCRQARGFAAIVRPVDVLRCVVANAGRAGAARAELASATRPAHSGVGAKVTAPSFPPKGVDPTPRPGGPVADCNPDPTTTVPSMVSSVFRCRLAEAGFNPGEVAYSAAEAVVVAQCESYFDPNVVVFDGKYLHTAHPATGSRYSAAGVFQFIRKTADKWIEGGYANVHDPVANIDAAARLYIHNVRLGIPPWSDWACVAANDGFRQTSVLPGYPGGPAALPPWAHQV